ncbi:MAG: NAD-dependent epimerase/dehydratase family protein [Candidatus Melainabacteria bacterium]|nr:NAD-dependent epimerase/dehydratase family protein [Candidatus Melainabacteria bacterium]
MRVLITGGAGFIGSHLADRLLERGDDVLVVDNYETGRRDNLQPHPKLQLVEGSIADESLMTRLFSDFKPQVVVHAAASYKNPDNTVGDALTNVVGTAVVVKQSQQHQVQRFIYFQTALCYGTPDEQPITLSHPLKIDATSYAISKTAGELYIQMSGLNWVSFRLANAYGPRNISGPLPTFFQRLSAGKPCFVVDTRRDFIYVEDLVEIAMLAVDGQGEPGAYHIASGSDVSIKELFDATVTAMGITLQGDVEVRPRSKDDAATILLDPSRTLQQFGRKPETPLAQGISKTIAYYREYGITETFTHLRHEEKPVVAV